MNIFLSYRFTGEDPKELDITLGKIISILRKSGNTVYCSIEDEAWFQEKKHSNREIMERAFIKLDESDTILAFIKLDEKSEGMLVEIGYAIAKKKRFALAIKKGVKTTSIAEMADPKIEFENLDDLCDQLKTFQ